MSDDEWISGDEAAELLGVSRTTVYRSLADDAVRQQEWGDEGAGWRRKPLSRRGIYQLRRSAVLAKSEQP